MTWQSVTALVIVCVVVGLVLYDLVVYAVAGVDCTISRVCLDLAGRSHRFALCFVFGLGVLVGHLFLPQHVPGPQAERKGAGR